MNPTSCLIERMKVVGIDIERRKLNVPDRFFSHFYFGPDKSSHSVRCLEHSTHMHTCAAFERDSEGRQNLQSRNSMHTAKP